MLVLELVKNFKKVFRNSTNFLIKKRVWRIFTRLLGKKIRDSVDDFLYKKLDRGKPFSFLESISKRRINNLPAVLQISWPAAAASAAGTS